MSNRGKVKEIRHLGSPVILSTAIDNELDGTPPMKNLPIIQEAPSRKTPRAVPWYIWLCLFLLIVLLVVMGVYFAFHKAFFIALEGFDALNEVADNDSSIEGFPDPTPTTSLTVRPTRTPTSFPTRSPIAEETLRPTRTPSLSPTFKPHELCASPDAICGCDLVVSGMIDVIFIMDESGSVGLENYNLLHDAILGFSRNTTPPLNPSNGTRIAYIEFSEEANDIIDFEQGSDVQTFEEAVENLTYTGGGTDHRRGIQGAHQMIKQPQNAMRPGSQLAVVMVTDGFPCVRCIDVCCEDSLLIANGTAELRAFRREFNFTFYFLPIIPIYGLPYDLGTFDDVMENPEDFVKFEPLAFSQLKDFLKGEEFAFPLGPCVLPPTVSSGSRSLFTSDAESLAHHSGLMET